MMLAAPPECANVPLEELSYPIKALLLMLIIAFALLCLDLFVRLRADNAPLVSELVEQPSWVVEVLRGKERCSLVVGMSHLGFYPQPQGGQIGDTQVASQVDGIDFIASGHTHTFMEKPVLQKNPAGKDTIIFQVGRSGIYVGRVDFTLREGKVTAFAGRLLDLRDESLA